MTPKELTLAVLLTIHALTRLIVHGVHHLLYSRPGTPILLQLVRKVDLGTHVSSLQLKGRNCGAGETKKKLDESAPAFSMPVTRKKKQKSEMAQKKQWVSTRGVNQKVGFLYSKGRKREKSIQ